MGTSMLRRILEVSIPHRKIAGAHDGTARVSGADRFPSLIGRSRASPSIRNPPPRFQFPSLIGRSRATRDASPRSSPVVVSIPHRKIAGLEAAAEEREEECVSIPHRKIAGRIERHRDAASIIVSIPHRKIAGFVNGIRIMRVTEFPSLIGRSRALPLV